MYDLIIIGGGPAGTAAAITGARRGAQVLLLERGRYPRHKVCGEFVSAESLGLLAGLLDSRHAAPLRNAVRIPSARVFADDRTLETPIQPAAASIARFDLDSSLWHSAEECGVETKQQVSAKNILGRGPFTVVTSAGDFAGRAVMNASGRWSNLASPASSEAGPEPKWIGLKGHFAEGFPPTSVDLYFFEGGYCGVQPVAMDAESGQQRVNVCAMVRADIARTLPEAVSLQSRLRERAAGWQPLTEPVSTSPLLFGQPQPVEKSILMVGDAAGFVDPFVGDGISLALRSGVLAAQCLVSFLEGEIALQGVLQQYAEMYRRRLAPVFQASSMIRRMLLMPRSLRVPILYLLENTPGLRRYLVMKTR